jgi:hypothetical protein
MQNFIVSKKSQTPESELVRKWWQWHVSLPNKTNNKYPTNLTLAHPREAYSPEKCAWNQNDENVWFLPDGRNLGLSEANAREIRECTVPHGKALLVQIYGGGYSIKENGLAKNEDLEHCVDIGLDTVEFTAKIDGVEVMSSKNIGNLPEPYQCELTYTQDNLYDVPAGPSKAMVGGYFLYAEPLSEGDHKIEIKETFSKSNLGRQSSSKVATEMATDRISNVVYNLTVL